MVRKLPPFCSSNLGVSRWCFSGLRRGFSLVAGPQGRRDGVCTILLARASYCSQFVWYKVLPFLHGEE